MADTLAPIAVLFFAAATVALAGAVLFLGHSVNRLWRRADQLQQQINDLWDRVDPAA